MKYIGFVIMVVLVATNTLSATIRVERDGTGDFVIIQDAVNAAASGDTIQIGPGRYDEREIVSTPGWTADVYVLVRQNELTLVGAGPDLTIIGPTEPWNLSRGFERGIEAGPWWGSEQIEVSEIGFENMAYAFSGADAPAITAINNCRFSDNLNSVVLFNGGEARVSGCILEGPQRDGILVFSHSMDKLVVEQCNFAMEEQPLWTKEALHVENTVLAEVSDSSFVGGSIGVGLYGADLGGIRNCDFRRQSLRSILVFGLSNLESRNCFFEGPEVALYFRNAGVCRIEEANILNVRTASVEFDGVQSLEIHNSILDSGERYAVWQSFPCSKSSADLPHLDLTGNDWGTSEADSIEAWISTCDYIVDYIPFIGMPVGVEEVNWGSVKSMFR